jgi:hypothetical protein
MVAITLVLHTVWGDGGLGNSVVLLVASCLGPRQNHFGGVRSCTGQRYMATSAPWITTHH